MMTARHIVHPLVLVVLLHMCQGFFDVNLAYLREVTYFDNGANERGGATARGDELLD